MTQFLLGCAALFLVAIGGMLLSLHGGSTSIDLWFGFIPRVRHSAVNQALADLGSVEVVAAGSVAVCACVVRRDPGKAVSCLAGPLLAGGLVEFVIKPAVGRNFEGVLTYPSGSVAGIAALSTVLLLAVPRTWRVPAGLAGLAVTLATAQAVVALRWHYPTDALAGLLTGAGAVLVTDSALAGRIRPLWGGS